MARPDIKKIKKYVHPYRITSGKGFRLKDYDPGDTRGLKSEFKGEAKALLTQGVQWLADEQARLYAQDRWSVLLLFQAMDAAGKDGTIKHVTAVQNTATAHAPWYVVPADNKWFTRMVVSAAIIERMEGLKLKFPKVDAARQQELAEARKMLMEK